MIAVLDRGALVALPRETRGRGVFRVAAPIVVLVGGEPITIAAGFTTDGASIPWWMRWRFDPWGRCGVPAVVHDWLLQAATLPKWQIDWIFYGLLKAEGVADLQAGLMFLAVRARRDASAARIPPRQWRP